jgi:hypothetical protein
MELTFPMRQIKRKGLLWIRGSEGYGSFWIDDGDDLKDFGEGGDVVFSQALGSLSILKGASPTFWVEPGLRVTRLGGKSAASEAGEREDEERI